MELDKEIFLKGKNLHLRPLKAKDIDGNYRFWLNDPEVVKYNSHGRFPQTPEKLLDYVRATESSNTIFVLAIIEKKKNLHIGNISLQAINWVDRNA